jgi:hypothetical protein
MFESLIALSISHMRIHLWEDGQPDKSTVRHYGGAISRLKSMLEQALDKNDNAIFFAILALMELEVNTPSQSFRL